MRIYKRGKRGYTLNELPQRGIRYDTIRGAIARHAGEEAAKTIVAAVAFDVTETRGLIDFEG